ncbi:MAG: 2-oxoacid:acceptor oxidoreductase family protein [Candidatus Syntropharchaeia archaeon]
MIEVRFHSRGGQGGVTAAKLLANAAFLEGKYSTAFAFYGPERRGSPTVSFTRIDEEEIKVYSQIWNPDCVVVMDPSIMDLVNVTSGMKKGGKILINGPNGDPPSFDGYEVYGVDATGIALDLNLKVAGTPILNTALMGVFARMGIVKLDSARKAIESMFSSSEKNIKAAEIAYDNLRKV